MQLQLKELYERADKENWDKETFRRSVEGQIERWGEQTFNERLKIGTDAAMSVINSITDVFSIYKNLPKVIKGFR